MTATVGSKVKAKGREGEVIVHDPEDRDMTYKVRFEDGTADWFQKWDVVVPGEEALAEEEKKKEEDATREAEKKAAASKVLIAAAKSKDAAKCKDALLDGADPDAANTDFFNYTALHLFAGQGDVDMVATLLNEYGAKVDPRSESMETPLIMAARAKHDKVVELLLDKGADLTAETNYEGPMRRSAQKYIDEMTGVSRRPYGGS